MGNPDYSPELCAELERRTQGDDLLFRHRPARYQVGRTLRVRVQGVLPAVEADVELRVEKFLGAGLAGQVYRCRLTHLHGLDGDPIPGLAVGSLYAVKIIVPPGQLARRFRNFIYWLAFQGPFSAQVNAAACRAGLLWQKLIRRAAGIEFGTETAVKNVYASFWDGTLNAFGEITEWIEGRTWLLEVDDAPARRIRWRNVPLDATQSREYVAKRRFMARMVKLLHDMGAAELARQYEWWTMKSQPNALKRTDVAEQGDAHGHCAIDFRAGLALLPFLPMSPADLKLILAGLFRRGALVQFDRSNPRKRDAYIAQHAEAFGDLQPAIEELRRQETAYRRSLPDLTHHGWRLPFDRALRQSVKAGLIEGYRAADLVDQAAAARLQRSGALFAMFYVLGALPVVGRLLRRVLCNAAYRRHLRTALTSVAYFNRALEAKACHALIDWHRAGRVSEAHARRISARPLLYLLQSALLLLCCGVGAGLGATALAGVGALAGWWAWPGLHAHHVLVLAVAGVVVAALGLLPIVHRAVTEPRFLWDRLKLCIGFIVIFFRDEMFREKWFLDLLEQGRDDGMLTADEHAAISARVRDPFIVKYLKCLAVHFATLPVTQIVSVAVGSCVVVWMLLNRYPWTEAAAAFVAVVALFQVLPISPGSICRGAFVVYLMVRERNIRDYLVAAPLSFVKYIGYLAFPLQMTTTYPHLARFLASRWATSAVHIVPVFGEKGALLEHWVFDLVFNVPQMLARWCMPRIRHILTGWLCVGVISTAAIMGRFDVALLGKAGINIILAAVCIFILPRVLFYPVLARARRQG